MPERRRRRWPGRRSAALALLPGAAILLCAFCGCVLWTAGLSVTPTRLMPRYEFIGLRNYATLLDDPRAWQAWRNLLLLGALFVGASLAAGVLLAVALDRLARGAQTALSLVFLAPLSLSWLVTGLLWQWVLNPELGLERALRLLGWHGARFDALVRQETALYVVAGAATWHAAGLVMALFLAGLRGIDPEIRRALASDGIPVHRAYLHVLLPMLRPQLFTAVVLLAFIVARMFDLVVAMTGGGPGFATDLPALYIYDHMFPRSRAGVAAAGAVMLMLTMLAVLAPYLAFELRRAPP